MFSLRHAKKLNDWSVFGKAASGFSKAQQELAGFNWALQIFPWSMQDGQKQVCLRSFHHRTVNYAAGAHESPLRKTRPREPKPRPLPPTGKTDFASDYRKNWNSMSAQEILENVGHHLPLATRHDAYHLCLAFFHMAKTMKNTRIFKPSSASLSLSSESDSQLIHVATTLHEHVDKLDFDCLVLIICAYGTTHFSKSWPPKGASETLSGRMCHYHLAQLALQRLTNFSTVGLNHKQRRHLLLGLINLKFAQTDDSNRTFLLRVLKGILDDVRNTSSPVLVDLLNIVARVPITSVGQSGDVTVARGYDVRLAVMFDITIRTLLVELTTRKRKNRLFLTPADICKGLQAHARFNQRVNDYEFLGAVKAMCDAATTNTAAWQPRLLALTLRALARIAHSAEQYHDRGTRQDSELQGRAWMKQHQQQCIATLISEVLLRVGSKEFLPWHVTTVLNSIARLCLPSEQINPLVRALRSSIISQIKSYTSKQLCAMLRAYAHLGTDDKEVLAALSSSLRPHTSTISSAQLCDSLHALARLRWRDESLLDGLLANILKKAHNGDFSSQQLTNSLHSLAVLRYGEATQCEPLLHAIRSKANQFSCRQSIIVMWSLVCLQWWDKECMDIMINRAVEHKAELECTDKNVLAQVQAILRHYQPLLVNLSLESLESEILQRGVQNHEPSVLHRHVSEVLQTMDIPHVCEHVLRHARCCVDVAVFPPATKVNVAIEVDGPFHYYLDTRMETGSTQLKRLLMGIEADWVLVKVPFYDWYGIRTQVEREEYLNAKLRPYRA